MSFFEELRRRDVIKVAIAYTAIAWLIAQVAELVLDATTAPGWILKTVLFVLAIGFPVALIFAWAYQITPEGIKLDKGGGASHKTLLPRRVVIRRRIAWTTSVAVIAILAFNMGTIRDWIGAPYAGQISSIAVLPLDNLMGDADQDYFVAGMTEALTAALGQIKALKVTSRTSASRYGSTDKKIPEIARELGVDALIEGSVFRDGDDVRITVQLIHGPTDSHIWSESYQRKLQDILILHNEVARTIARKIQVTVTHETETRLAIKRPADPKALQAWFIGNYHMTHWNEGSFQKALEQYDEAITRDPNFAPAWAGKAFAYIQLGGWHATGSPENLVPKAEEAAMTALELDPDLGEAHLALGMVRRFQWDWDEADKSFKRGVALNPNDTNGLSWYSNFLTTMGRFEESIRIARLDLELNPRQASTLMELGYALWIAGPDDEALENFQRALEVEPDYLLPHDLIGQVYLKRGVLHSQTPDEKQRNFKLALEHLELLEQDPGVLSPSDKGLLARHYGMLERPDKARQYLSELKELQNEGVYISPVAFADAYVGLGEHTAALEWLWKAFEERDVILIFANVEWVYRELRASDHRFQEIFDQLNIPEA